MSKRNVAKCLILTVVLLLLVFCGCTPQIEYADPAVIALAVDGAMTSGYVAGDELVIDDAVLYVTYDNDDIESIPLTEEMIDKTSFDMTVPGKQTVVIRYGGCATSFDIEIQSWELSTVTLISTPYDTDYVVGESVDPTGAVIRMSFQQNSNSPEPRYQDIPVIERYLEAYDKETVGTKTIYLNYANTRLHFDVNYTEKTATSVEIIKKPNDNYVFIDLGQFRYYLRSASGNNLNKNGMEVETAQTYYYDVYDDAMLAKNTFEKQNKAEYTIEYANRFDFSGMSLRIGFDNNQTPEYDATTGVALETDAEGNAIYDNIDDLASCITISIDDDVERTVEAVLMYLPKDYPEEFVYNFYGATQLSVGDKVEPGWNLSSNAIERNGERIALDSIKSKSYGVVKSIDVDKYGHGTIVVSTLIDYVLTEVAVKEGDIIAPRAPLGLYGKDTINSNGGGIVLKVKNGVVTVRTAPTTVFTSKVQAKAFKSISLINIDRITPLLYPDTGIDSMIQGDTIDLSSGVVTVTAADGTLTERGPVRVDYTDGSFEYFKLNSSMISVVNAGVETISEGLDVSRAGRYVLWVVYGGVVYRDEKISYYTELSVGVNSRYPVALNIVSSTNNIHNNRFYFGETISIASMRYTISYDNGSVSEERQITEDMLAEGYNLYCAPEESAYLKTVCFKLKEEDLTAIPEGVNRNIFSEIYRCKVIPSSIAQPDIEVVEAAKKVYVEGDDNIDLTGAIYSVKYIKNASKTLEGKAITESEGNALSIGGNAFIETEIRGETRPFYIDDNYTFHVDDGTTTINLSTMHQIGVRKIARLVYRDRFYNDCYNDLNSGSDPHYYTVNDLYTASVEFYYYVITESDWSVTDMKVNLSTNGGIKGYKDTYAQYEYWDMSGITVTLTIEDKTGSITTSTIPATGDMIYDSTTSRITDDVPVKFTFLGATDNDTLHISVGKRSEEKLELIQTGRDTYLSTSATNGMDFSDYVFYLHYNAGPYDVIKNLKRVSVEKKASEECWWYEIYQKNYVIRNENGDIVDITFEYDEFDAITGFTSEIADETKFYTDKAQAVGIVETLAVIDPTHTYTIDEIKGVKLSGLDSQTGEVLVLLHHFVPLSETTKETDVAVAITINVIDSEAIMGVRYIGTNDEYIDTARKVAGQYPAGYGTGKEYTVLDAYGASVVVDAQGNIAGTVVSSGAITPAIGYQIYYPDQETADTVLARLLTFSVQELGNKFFIANDNGSGVDSTGAVGNTVYYDKRTSVDESLRWIRRYSTPYYAAYDVSTGKYIIKNSLGRPVTSTGVVLYTYYRTEDDAYLQSDRLNGIVAADDSEFYYVSRTIDNKVNYLENSGFFGDNYANRMLFSSAQVARNYLTSKNLQIYSVTNTLYVIAEIAAGWDIMLNEYINNVLVEKKLTVYYASGEVGEVAITPEMISYNKMDSSIGYRKVTITYKNYSCEAFIYVWRAELTGVEISKTPLTNYIRYSALDVSEGILKLTFTKYNQRNQESGYMYKFISMESEDITYTGFSSERFSKTGTNVTVNVLYKDYYTLTTSYVVVIYDLQDVSFTFNNTIFFYGNVSAAGFTATKIIPEFTLPKWGNDGDEIVMRYIEKKNLIPYKQYIAMGLTEDEQKGYKPVTVYDERGDLATLYYISVNDIRQSTFSEDGKENPAFYDPASGSYYAIYSKYVMRDDNGNIVERYTDIEYNALSDEDKAKCERVVGEGDILYTYTESEYEDLSSDQRVRCVEVTNSYYLLMMVEGNKYYETRNYCLQEYAIIPKVIDIKVTSSNQNAFILRVHTGDDYSAINYLLNPSNLLPLTNPLKETYQLYISNISLVSPHGVPNDVIDADRIGRENYFELMVELLGSQRDESVMNAVRESFYTLLSALANHGITDIRLGSLEYLSDVEHRNSYFVVNPNRKKYVSGEMNTAVDYYMYDYIDHTMREGVNIFTTLKPDTEYSITYEVAYGELLVRSGHQELLSGQILLRNNGDGSFTTVQGSLGHSSYTIDLSPITVNINNKTSAKVAVVNNNETDRVLRLYMKNAPEVYSRWYIAGEFDALKNEILSEDRYNAFLSDLSVISPNNNFFEVMFSLDGSTWTGSAEQLSLLYAIAGRLVNNIIGFGAKEVYFGGDVHQFGNGISSGSGVAFFSDGNSFERTVKFTAKASETSISKLYSDYLDDISSVSTVISGLSIDAGINNYVLQFKVVETWIGNDSEKDQLAAACLAYLKKMLSFNGENKLFYGEHEITLATDVSEIRSLVDRLGVNNQLVFRLPIRYQGDVWTFVRGGYCKDVETEILVTSYSSYVTDVTLYTADKFSSITFAWTGSGENADKLDEAFYLFLVDMRDVAEYIYYGADVERSSDIVSEDIAAYLADDTSMQAALKEGVNVFTYNSKQLYEVSYTVSTDLLHFSDVSVLLAGDLDVDDSGSTTGLFGVTIGTMNGNVLYDVSLDASAGTNKVKIK